MKKMTLKNASKYFISASLRGLAVFAVFGFALYAYAVTYPATDPGPVTGVVGLFVGGTTSTYAGDAAGDYQAANDYCNALVEGARVCTPMEMINTYNYNPSAISGETASFWINAGPPGYISNLNNDCSGWSSNSSIVFGSVWNTTTDSSFITSCDLSRAYACCR